MIQVFALEIDLGANCIGESMSRAQGRGPADVGRQHFVNLPREGGIAQCLLEGGRELVESGNQSFGDVPAAKRAKTSLFGNCRHLVSSLEEGVLLPLSIDAERAASAKARIFA